MTGICGRLSFSTELFGRAPPNFVGEVAVLSQVAGDVVNHNVRHLRASERESYCDCLRRVLCNSYIPFRHMFKHDVLILRYARIYIHANARAMEIVLHTHMCVSVCDIY